MSGILDGMEDTVTAVWGEEKIQLAPFQMVTVGPFSYSTRVRKGETPEQAFERALRVVVLFAEKERKRKVEEFRRAYRAATDD